MRDYAKADFLALVELARKKVGFSKGLIELLNTDQADGVFFRTAALEALEDATLAWKPAHDMTGSDKPRSHGPALPFPFTANQLAAFLLHGWVLTLPKLWQISCRRSTWRRLATPKTASPP